MSTNELPLEFQEPKQRDLLPSSVEDLQALFSGIKVLLWVPKSLLGW
jgi:hypothetical protein